MNLVCLLGKITKDAVIEKVGKDQISKAVFNLAVNRDYKNAEGKYDADFPRIIAWKGSADYVQKYAPKGTTLEVVGKIQTGSYVKDGKTVYTTDIVAESVKVVYGTSSTATATHNAPVTNHTENAEATVDDITINDIDISNNDLPF